MWKTVKMSLDTKSREANGEAKQSFLLSYVQRSDAGRIRGGWESLEDYSGASFTKILILIFFQVYNLEWFELEEC